MDAVAFDHVTKRFRGPTRYRSLREDIAAFARRDRGARPAIVALDDVSFTLAQGTATAIIGRNGAGKTTALKLISRITYPSDGTVRFAGRVGALIEVGTGLHPELTGRENVFLYGRILGFSRRDIARLFDEIVEFAEVGHALAQPVKQFSSGMQLRLGFALAAHLEPDILLVDEAIAVGDAGFQYKCVERMSRLVREGRTLLFVSHDMSAVETLCDRVLVLDGGRLTADGPARNVVRSYLEAVQSERFDHQDKLPDSQLGFALHRVETLDDSGTPRDVFHSGEGMTVRLAYRCERSIERPYFSIGISDGRGPCFSLASMLQDGQMPERIAGTGSIDCAFEALPLHPRTYEIWASVRGESGFGDLVDWQLVRRFRVVGEEGAGKSATSFALDNSPVKLPYAWRLND